MRVDDEWPENTCVDGGKRAKSDENDVRRPEREENDVRDGRKRTKTMAGRGAGKAGGGIGSMGLEWRWDRTGPRSDGAKRCGILDVAGWGNLAKEISRL